MNVVIDTNVLGSALLRQGTPPAAVVEALVPEYREVLARPKFGFDVESVDALLRFIMSAGLLVSDAAFSHALPDPDDQPFADVAFTGGADALITGNKVHFPVDGAIQVVTPMEWLAAR